MEMEMERVGVREGAFVCLFIFDSFITDFVRAS